MAINKRVKHFGPWKNKMASPMTMSKKGQSATLALLTYELFLTIRLNCTTIIVVKAKWDHYTLKKKAVYNHFANYKLIKNNHIIFSFFVLVFYSFFQNYNNIRNFSNYVKIVLKFLIFRELISII